MSAEESTKGRQGKQPEPKAPAWVRFGMRALATGAPPLAAWVGERLFLTPPRHEAPTRERKALRDAAAFDVPFRGGRLRAWRWGGEGAPVLLVHGWGGRGGQMAAFAPSLVAAGLPVVTFDGPAHGRSDGRLASAPDFAAAIRAVVERLRGVRAVVSHSMGAPATVLALRDGLAVEAAVFVGGSLGPRGFLRQFGQALGLSETTRAAVARRLEDRFGGGFEDYDLRTDCAAMTIPLMVVHDRLDGEVPFAQGEAIALAWPGAEMVTTEGLGHGRILRDPAVVARVSGFVATHLGARPPATRLARSATQAEPRCAAPGCSRTICLSWDADGRFCASCALAADLFDRSARQALTL